jgi:hypothetical protein
MAHGWYSSIMHGDACSPLNKSSRASTDSNTNNIISRFHHFIQLTVIMAFMSTSAGLTYRLGCPAEALVECMLVLKNSEMRVSQSQEPTGTAQLEHKSQEPTGTAQLEHKSVLSQQPMT